MRKLKFLVWRVGWLMVGRAKFWMDEMMDLWIAESMHGWVGGLVVWRWMVELIDELMGE